MRSFLHQIPLYLTISRIVLVPAIAVAFHLGTKRGYYVALSFFLLAVITDIFDGHLARRFGVASEFGRFLDAVADKLLIIVGVSSLLMVHAVSYHCAVLVFAREILADAIRNYSAGKGQVVRHDIYGRLQMSFNVLAISYALLGLSGIGPTSERLVLGTDILLYVGIVFGLLSVREAWPKFVDSVADPR